MEIYYSDYKKIHKHLRKLRINARENSKRFKRFMRYTEE